MNSAIVPQSAKQLMDRFEAARGSARLTREELEQVYWGFHPRFRFFKTVRNGAKLLDLGANEGGLAQWKGWCSPDRSDIEMYGVDLADGQFSELYRSWESLNLDDSMPSFPGVFFDAFLCSHLIEHIERPEELIQWMAKKSLSGARLYLEWPNQTSLDLPTRDELAQRGWPVMISNFHDDDTHIRLKSLEEISELVSNSGFQIVESGVIDAGDLTDQLIDMGSVSDDPSLTLAGFWSLTHWATYLIAERI